MEQDFSDINERNDFDMNTLLIFFALPIAVIIISIALQKILKCPLLVSAIIFSIFLIVTFVVNNLNFLVAAIIYAIIIQNNNPFGKENRGKSVKKQFFRLFCWKMIQKFKIIFLILRPVRENKFY